MSPYSAFPFVRVLLAFIPGILLSDWIPVSTSGLMVLLAVLFTLQLLQIKNKNLFELGSNWKSGFAPLLFIFISAIIICKINYKTDSKNHFTNIIEYNQTQICFAKVSGVCEQKEKSYKIPIELEALYLNNKWKPCFGKSIFYLKKSDQEKFSYSYGDQLIFLTRFNHLTSNHNPGEFDYASYLKMKGVECTAYSAEKPLLVSHQTSLYSVAETCANNLKNLIYTHCTNKKIASFLVALLIGQKSEVDDEVMKGFSITGTLHVLSVSGLHTGLLFIAFQTLLQLILGKEKRRALFTISLLILLWSYAFITGLSPSVTRAVMMFSLVIIGRYFNFKSNIYNSIAAAALMLLCINPYNLYQLSFLLSFLAVLGIVYLQEKIYQLFYFKNLLIDKIWLLCSVSIAAQLATLPLCLYSFSSFPSYFILANLIVIPLTTLILYLTLISVLFSMIPVINELLFYCLEILVQGLFSIIGFISELPVSTLSISIQFYECILLYGSFCILLLYFIHRKIKLLNFTLAILCFTFIFRLYHTLDKNQSQELIILADRNFTSIYYYSNQKNILISDSIPDSRTIQQINLYALHQKRKNVSFGINKSDSVLLEKHQVYYQNGFYQFSNYLLFEPEKNTKIYPKTSRIKTDLLILNYYPKHNLDEILKKTQPKLVLLSLKLSNWYRNELRLKLEEKNIMCYDQQEKGAFKVVF